MTIDPLENLKAVRYGGAGLGIPQAYPVAEHGSPFDDEPGDRIVITTWQALNEFGFNRPGEGPLGPDGNPLLLTALLDESQERIVATWDEGRWWTPGESEAFLQAMADPMLRVVMEATTAINEGNRAQRRRKRRRR